MLGYRVFPYLDTATAAKDTGHPLYLHKPQGNNRLDNPDLFDMWYLAQTAEGAIAETFGDLASWSEAMFDFPILPGSRRSLGLYEFDDRLSLLDMDDATNLADRRLRPTHVVGRQRTVSRAWARKAFQESHGTGERMWAGVKWWSFQRPHWTIYGLWVAPGESTPLRPMDVRAIDINSPEVVSTANSLVRLIV